MPLWCRRAVPFVHELPRRIEDAQAQGEGAEEERPGFDDEAIRLVLYAQAAQRDVVQLGEMNPAGPVTGRQSQFRLAVLHRYLAAVKQGRR